MTTRHGLDHRHSLQVPRLWLELVRARDRIFFGGQQGLVEKVGHQTEHCRFRDSPGTGVSFAGAVSSATYYLGRRAKLPVDDRDSIQFHPVL